MIVAGVDEVGRGTLAGPVMACAVVFLPNLDLVKETLTKSRLESKPESLAIPDTLYSLIM
ncbi:hypothetical protein IIC44_02630 [Patescibacteria group bacterium]|nr:hypothetical protein [Patescibacteria group bacterium]